MSIEDQPTQQIRRPEASAPMPGTLNPTYRTPAPAPPDTAENGSTEVLSLDELLDGPPAATPPAATAVPITPAPAAAQAPAPASAAPRIGAVPVRSAQPTTPTDSNSSRLRGDAAAAWRGGIDRSRTWLTSGDNAVVAATVLIALFLLLAVALF